MSYDPNLSQNGQLVDGDKFREQFSGLKDLIDVIAPGTITAVIIDAMTTVGPKDPASTTVSLIGTELPPSDPASPLCCCSRSSRRSPTGRMS